MTSNNAIVRLLKRHSVAICAALTAFAAIVPFARIFFRAESNYNEGWNIYNAARVANHEFLYPVRYGWTSVNYPMTSFVIFAQLHRITHDYLFTARAVSLLSLIACSCLVGAIARTLAASRRAALLAGVFCFALFCAHAPSYVGTDDPQMLAQVFFMLGLLVYLRNRNSAAAIIATALLFVFAGSIKHNLLSFPVVVLLDLIVFAKPKSWSRTLLFALAGIAGVIVLVLLNVHFGGPRFIAQMLAPRGYSVAHLLDQLLLIIGPILPMFCIAAFAAWSFRHDAARRILTVFFVTALCLSGYFSGGSGVSINAMFDLLLAISILLGLFINQLQIKLKAKSISSRWSELAAVAPVLMFVWLLVPMIISGNWNPITSLRDVAAAQRDFDEDVAFLRSQPGPALCESLLECNFADKPYVYDPFNATRLIRMHKLDPQPLLDAIRNHEFGAVETNDSFARENEYDSERWDSAVRDALRANYKPVIERKGELPAKVIASSLYVPIEAAPR